MRVLGLDPGLVNTGWGMIVVEGSSLHHIAPRRDLAEAFPANGRTADGNPQRCLCRGRRQAPDVVAIEETFVSLNAASTLKLGLARGAALVAAASTGLVVSEYATRLVKKTVVGTGRAEKHQVAAMIAILFPGARPARSDAADALAVAVCHAHHDQTFERIKAGLRT